MKKFLLLIAVFTTGTANAISINEPIGSNGYAISNVDNFKVSDGQSGWHIVGTIHYDAMSADYAKLKYVQIYDKNQRLWTVRCYTYDTYGALKTQAPDCGSISGCNSSYILDIVADSSSMESGWIIFDRLATGVSGSYSDVFSSGTTDMLVCNENYDGYWSPSIYSNDGTDCQNFIYDPISTLFDTYGGMSFDIVNVESYYYPVKNCKINLCPAGEYLGTQYGQPACVKCPNGGHSAEGSTSVNACYLKAGGTYSDSSGSFTVSSDCSYQL